MAARAGHLIHEGDTIFIDAGTSCFYLAPEIQNMNIRVITNSLAVILELSSTPGINLHSVGGGVLVPNITPRLLSEEQTNVYELSGIKKL